ncbi:acyl carrier protein [Micromonospora auratinigra]|uniref:Act minimal PKS acyl carrier protein n=1 Tax=Micromonospora auratinigra TaxID=261654 RepID=A0A1A8ZG52_9ACTN|nr:acyl carrier protein [Micromonospora auratinigra]SBT42853.1 act minimal PKS acyl carrier protein [Micromonospora auratinigra]
MAPMTLDDLRTTMTECAGVDENIDLGGDIADVEFADLGYDSLAMLETGSRIERRYGIRLAEEEVTEARTPRLLLDLVNRSLTGDEVAAA